jgi:RNA polymerase sigma-70 factor (ECF subfamily)
VTAIGRGVPAVQAVEKPDPGDWVQALTLPGPGQATAMLRLHELLLRAARHQAWRMRPMLGGGGADLVEEIANQAADEAMVSLLAKLPTFEGRSRFTTWAYKFAILQTAVEVRRYAWLDREVPLDDPELIVERAGSPEQYAEAADVAVALRTAISEVLSPHQRRIVLALLIDEVPVDVLAERLGSSRNALYKTLHDARTRLRTRLITTGYFVETNHLAGPR